MLLLPGYLSSFSFFSFVPFRYIIKQQGFGIVSVSVDSTLLFCPSIMWFRLLKWITFAIWWERIKYSVSHSSFNLNYVLDLIWCMLLTKRRKIYTEHLLQDPVIGGSLLLTYTTGYVAPLLLAASFAGALQVYVWHQQFVIAFNSADCHMLPARVSCILNYN